MFRNAEAFDIPIGGWNTGLVEQISSMFDGAAKFNQDLPWDTSQVEYMTSVFQKAYAFNGDVSGWNTAKVASLLRPFRSDLSVPSDPISFFFFHAHPFLCFPALALALARSSSSDH